MSRCSANIGITFDGVGGDDVDVDEQKHAHNAFVLLHLNMMHPCKYACMPNTNNRWFHYELSLLVVHHFQRFRLYVVSYFSYSHFERSLWSNGCLKRPQCKAKVKLSPYILHFFFFLLCISTEMYTTIRNQFSRHFTLMHFWLNFLLHTYMCI